ncbi:MAG: hypothetical protein ACREAY_11790 [Nitrososphaera sp.]|uniref:hypothetical protein n=1 Tax=Nitrososphaera sp. TaxID=1971748 RepID=UPI003D6F81AF
MVTRGTISINAPKQAAYDALLAACKDMDAKIKYANAESFTVDGESGTMWLQNRFSFRFYARLRDQHDGAMLEVHDFSPFRMDKKLLRKLFEKIEKKVSVTEPAYDDVQRIDPVPEQKAPPPSWLPTAPVKAAEPAKAAAPRLLVEGGRIKGREYTVRVEGGEEALADRMTIVPIEAGNLVRLTKGDFLVREIPISSIERRAVFRGREGPAWQQGQPQDRPFLHRWHVALSDDRRRRRQGRRDCARVEHAQGS